MTAEHPAADPALARFLLHAEAGLRRVSCEVNGEQISFFVRQGKLRAQCTCGGGAREGASEVCEHHKLAASLLGLDGSSLASSADPSARASQRPSAPFVAPELVNLARALDELCLAMARTGLDAPDSPSIREALDAVLEHGPKPPSLTLSRWIGRISEALEVGEVGKVARLLDGAQRLVSEVSAGSSSPQSLANFRSWIGTADGESPNVLADSVLIEVGREWLTGTSRASLERRYMIDVHDGAVYSEERRRGDQNISVGPCPRVVHASYGELDDAVQPCRLRLLQYTVSPEPTQEQWQRLTEFACGSVSELASSYARIARRVPGTSEPFVLFSPAGQKLGSEPSHVRDARGAGIGIVDDVDVPMLDALRAMAEADEVLWIGGRLTGLARGLALRPISMLLRREGRFSLRRVT